MAAGFEAFCDGRVSRNAVGVLLGMERRFEDCIRVSVTDNHNVMIAAAKANGEVDGVVCTKVSNVLYGYMQFVARWVGQHRGISWGDRRYGDHIALGALECSRARALAGLMYVAAEGLGRSREVISGVLVSETGPRGVVAGFDGGYPGGADRESSGGM